MHISSLYIEGHNIKLVTFQNALIDLTVKEGAVVQFHPHPKINLRKTPNQPWYDYQCKLAEKEWKSAMKRWRFNTLPSSLSEMITKKRKYTSIVEQKNIYITSQFNDI